MKGTADLNGKGTRKNNLETLQMYKNAHSALPQSLGKIIFGK